jgi:hypothetical protein
MTMTESDADRQVCPRCHLPAVPIQYGLPNERGEQLLRLGLVADGGCMIMRDAPTLTCPRAHQWRPADPDAPVPPVAGDDDPLVAAARRYLAGDLVEAERAYRGAARAAGEMLGERHFDTLALRHAVAIVLYRAGRLAEGEAEYREIRAAAGFPLTATAPTLAELRAIVERRNRLAGHDPTD